MDDERPENPELDEVVEEATADGEPGDVAAQREVDKLAGDGADADPQDGWGM